ncbi:MOSC and FAD-binding oxidoreductase domain-containing protein [Pseudonocardia sp. TRM90224]|uniref:MOSC and FAD-binding oxidoreductase domain-containing protein n=1 Tax=Pseudonocardia sp. TRM90224 TaxID=2812678 RepID=UPI001E288C3B|nr:MOSC and FAD-binding oxidoreductase domain-containing protein [Pseudonocardia sp. TRM90224]
MPTLVSVNVGEPRDVEWNGATVHTGAWKYPVDGGGTARRLGIDGDGQGDTAGHGGPNRAVLVYQLESYRYWSERLGRGHLEPGTFAENLTVEGLADTEVCIGDRYRIGEAEFEVSQPRVTCYRAGLRIGEPQLAALLVAHHRPGFYMRVVREGRVRAGDPIVRTATGPERVSVADADALLYLPDRDLDTLRRAVRIPALSPGWQASLRQLLAEAEHQTTKDEPAWAGFRALTVTDVVRESAAVSSIHLADPEGVALPSARPGQYLTLRSPVGVRSYSLSAAPGAYRISVKRELGGAVSGYIHDTVRPGTTVEAAAPRGEFVLDDGAAPVVLVSAGIGITPVLAMLHRLAAERTTREVWWLHAARTPDEQAFAAEAHELLATLPCARTRVFHSAAGERLTAERIAELGLPADATAYVCGPAGFMADVSTGLRAAGLDAARIRSETFGALAAIRPGIVGTTGRAPHLPAGEPGTGPRVTFARSGVTAPFDTRRSSLLEFAEACDVPARWQCRSGVCRTCETPLLSGTVDYSPAPLEEPSPGTVLVCCARPRDEVVVDM